MTGQVALPLRARGLLGAGVILIGEHAVLVGDLAVILTGLGLDEQLVDDEPGVGADRLLDRGRDLRVLLQKRLGVFSRPCPMRWPS